MEWGRGRMLGSACGGGREGGKKEEREGGECVERAGGGSAWEKCREGGRMVGAKCTEEGDAGQEAPATGHQTGFERWHVRGPGPANGTGGGHGPEERAGVAWGTAPAAAVMRTGRNLLVGGGPPVGRFWCISGSGRCVVAEAAGAGGLAAVVGGAWACCRTRGGGRRGAGGPGGMGAIPVHASGCRGCGGDGSGGGGLPMRRLGCGHRLWHRPCPLQGPSSADPVLYRPPPPHGTLIPWRLRRTLRRAVWVIIREPRILHALLHRTFEWAVGIATFLSVFEWRATPLCPFDRLPLPSPTLS